MLKKGRTKEKIVAVSGYFDPLHIGHIRYIRDAKKLGDKLVVILSRDDQCIAKKGYVFMPYEERKEILLALKWVDEVVMNIDDDLTVTRTLEKLKPDIFAKGGDRTPETMPKSEIEVCKRLGINLVFGVGGEKIQSSSWLVQKIKNLNNISCWTQSSNRDTEWES